MREGSIRPRHTEPRCQLIDQVFGDEDEDIPVESLLARRLLWLDDL